MDIIEAPGYRIGDKNVLINDIALVKLDQPVPLIAKQIETIPMWAWNEEEYDVGNAIYYCYIVGWGATSPNSLSDFTNELNEGRVTYTEPNICA